MRYLVGGLVLWLGLAAAAPGQPRVVINEFMASNASTIQDEFGDYDDWLELYNDEAVPISLGGMYLTDDPVNNPLRWRLPVGLSIPAKGFLLLWPDGEPTEGPLHGPFRLSADGESIALIDTDSNDNEIIDQIPNFPAQLTDVSYGRLPDGGAVFDYLDRASPGGPNGALPTATPSQEPTATPTPSATPGVDGDLDNDGDVDSQDLLLFLRVWHQPTVAPE